jgi:hypothetical protein
MPEEKNGRSRKSTCEEDISFKNSNWSKMLAKVFKIHVTKCQHCKGYMVIRAAITKRSEVGRHLKHFRLELESPATVPPRYREEPFEFGYIKELLESMHTTDD